MNASFKKLIFASPHWMHEAGCSGLMHWDDPEGWDWEGRWEGGSGWGAHVYPWLIHVNVWQKPPQNNNNNNKIKKKNN